MAITITEYDQATFQSGFAWNGGPYSPGIWVLSISGLDGGSNTTALRNPGADNGDPNWQLLTVVDAGPNLPTLVVWARKITEITTLHNSVPGQGGLDSIGILYFLTGLRDSSDASEVFSVGSASSETSDTSQTVPYYAPDGTETVIGVWYSGSLSNYTSLGGLTARTELDGVASTARAGEMTALAAGPSSITATSSVAAPWAALTLAARKDSGTSVTFPQQPLDVTVEAALGANPNEDPSRWASLWTDITDYVYTRDRLSITRGRQDEASTVTPSSMTVTLNNEDGRFTRLNPSSPYFGKLSKNTPLRTWVDAGAGKERRITALVSEWPPRSQGADIDQNMPVRADGVLRRLGKGRVLNSPVYRAITSGAAGSVTAYWPLEQDGTSAVEGQADFISSNGVSFGTTDLPGSAGAVSTDVNAKMSGPVVGMTDPTGWTIGYFFECPSDFNTATDTSAHVRWTTAANADGSGNHTQWFIGMNPTNPGVLTASVAESGTSIISVFTVKSLVGVGPVFVLVRAMTDGSSIRLGINLICSSFTEGYDILPPNPPAGVITGIGLNGNLNQTVQPKGSISHLYISPAYDLFNPINQTVWSAGLGYSGERAADRILRLASEDNVPLAVEGDDGQTQRMGPQPIADFLDVIRDVESADGGVLYERKDGRLGYQTRSYRYNKDTALVLENPKEHIATPFEPTDDDKNTLNSVLVSRNNGGSVRVEDQDSVSSIGLYSDSVSLNLADDVDLDDQAGWRVHLGTSEDLRYPVVSPALMASPELIYDWCGVDVGSAANLVDLPNDLPPGNVPLIVEGYTESFDEVSWEATANCSPGSSWNVGFVDDSVYSHVDTDGSSLAAPLGAPGAAPTTLSEDFEDTTYNVTITNGGNASWARSSTTSHSGSWSFKAGTITDNQTSDAVITVPAGYKTLTFWYRVSSEYTFDFLVVLVDGVEKSRFSGEIPWTRGALNVTGTSTVTFRYQKDGFTSAGSDTAYIDDLLFTTPEKMSVVATAGPLWTTNPADLAFDVVVGGEQVTVVDITSQTVLNSDPGFNTVGAWSASGGSFTASGVGQLTPNGTSGTVQVFSTPRVNVTADGGYTATALLQDSVSRSVNFVVNWYNVSNSLISSSTKATSLVANTLTAVSMDVVAPTGATKAEIGATMTGTPPATNVLFLDEMYLIERQVFSVIRSVNGVIKSHSSGEDVRLAYPSIVSL